MRGPDRITHAKLSTREQRVCFVGSVQESVNTCVFAGFLSDRLVGHPRHRILSTCVIGNVFKPFVILFMPSLVAISFCAQFPKRLAQRCSPGTRQLPPNRELVCRKGSRKSADLRDRARIGEHPPSNQSLRSASQGFCRNLPRKRNGPRRSRIGHHRLRSSRYTRSPRSQAHPPNPEAPGFRNPRQLSTFTDSRAEPFC